MASAVALAARHDATRGGGIEVGRNASFPHAQVGVNVCAHHSAAHPQAERIKQTEWRGGHGGTSMGLMPCGATTRGMYGSPAEAAAAGRGSGGATSDVAVQRKRSVSTKCDRMRITKCEVPSYPSTWQGHTCAKCDPLSNRQSCGPFAALASLPHWLTCSDSGTSLIATTRP